MVEGLPERIRGLRDKLARPEDKARSRPLSQQRLADLLGVSQPQVSRWEQGEDTPEDPVIRKMAGLAEMEFYDFKYAENKPLTIPVSGYIRNETIETVGGDGVATLHVKAVAGLPDTAGICAAIIDDNSLRPHRPGTKIFYHRDGDTIPAECLNELCVVHLTTGETLVKWLRRGYQDGRYNLESFSGASDLMENCELRWAAKVLSIGL